MTTVTPTGFTCKGAVCEQKRSLCARLHRHGYVVLFCAFILTECPKELCVFFFLLQWFVRSACCVFELAKRCRVSEVHGLLLRRTSLNGRRKTIRQTRYRRLGNPTQLPATTRHHQHKHHHTYNCNTKTRTQCPSVHRATAATPPRIFVDIDIQLLAKFLFRGVRICATCHEWHTNFAVCSIPLTRTNGPLTSSKREKI